MAGLVWWAEPFRIGRPWRLCPNSKNVNGNIFMQTASLSVVQNPDT